MLEVTLLALIWGLISAVSLPVGAVIGLYTKPTQRATSSLMAFGGGALLFALTIELFAHCLHRSHESHDNGIIFSMILGALAGGIIFEILNQLLCNKGAFLRKASLFTKYVKTQKKKNVSKMISRLSEIRFLQLVSPDDIIELIPFLITVRLNKGEIIFSQGDTGDELYFIVRGKVKVLRGQGTDQTEIAELGPGDTFGEIALISDKPRTATVEVSEEVELYLLSKADFETLLKMSPELQNAGIKLVSERLEGLCDKDSTFKQEAFEWQNKAQKKLGNLNIPVSGSDMDEEADKHKSSAALAIWLGIALDGIPESIVIGILTVSAVKNNTAMSLAFIAGVFMANLPEAMSSAVTMKKQGTSFKKIFWMWMSLCIMTGFGAALGTLIFSVEPEGMMLYAISAIEGIAAGAMLTMIANTMLPEAYDQGGSTIVGLSTLAGFIAALLIKIVG